MGIGGRPASLRVLAAAVVVLLAVGAPRPVAAQRSLVFEDFQSDITVQPDASLLIRETLRPRFTGSWNGILRDLSLEPPASYHASEPLRVELISATDGDGNPLRHEVNRPDRLTRQFKVWVPNARDRTATVVLTYRVRNALGFFQADPDGRWTAMDELYWNVTGTEWEVPILRASARVNLPDDARPRQVAAYVGREGSGTRTPVDTAGNTVVVPAVGPLDPGEGLTVGVGWDAGSVDRSGAVAANARPATQGGPVGFGAAGPSLSDAGLLDFLPLLLPFLAFWLGYRAWDKRGRDPKERAISVQYEPPAELSPAEVGTLIDNKAGMHDVISTLVDLAVRGAVHIEEREGKGLLGLGKDYAFHLMRPRDQWDDLAPHEREFLDGLFSHGSKREALAGLEKSSGVLNRIIDTVAGPSPSETAPKGAIESVLLSDLKNRFYKDLPGIKDAIYEALVRKGFYDARPDKVTGRWVFIAFLGVFVGAIGIFPIASGTPDGVVAGGALIVAGVLSAIILGIFAGLMPARTESGARTREAALGFKRFLERVEEPRYKRMITSPDQFEAYLPFAMAFQCEETWAKAFEDLLTEPPDWYHGPGGVFHASAFASSVSSLSTAAGTTLSSSPGSSGSGGGGSVGGGGGGGGGGGF